MAPIKPGSMQRVKFIPRDVDITDIEVLFQSHGWCYSTIRGTAEMITVACARGGSSVRLTSIWGSMPSGTSSASRAAALTWIGYGVGAAIEQTKMFCLIAYHIEKRRIAAHAKHVRRIAANRHRL